MSSHVLLILCGISPAIITETVWALRHDLPEKIVVITTQQGAACIREELFSSGIWKQLKTQLYAQSPVFFGDNSSSIRLIPQNFWSNDAEDVQSSQDSEEFADFLLDQLRQFTENADVRLTFSISGGRKTMSVIGALCLSLLGRREDKMCHVLVKPPFDRNDLSPKFYYPQKHQRYQLPDGSCYQDEDAEITLCEIPYVHQRYIFGERVTQLGSYRNLVASANGILNPSASAILTVYPQESQIEIGTKKIALPFGDFLLYYFLVLRRSKDLPALNGTKTLYEEFFDAMQIFPADGLTGKIADCHYEIMCRLKKLNAENLRKVISSITGRFHKLQIPISSGIYPSPKRGQYGLTIAKEHIHITNT